MKPEKTRYCYLLLVILSALFVYVVGHYEALTNQYVINDDVRQQIYWMQRWQDPELFQDDFLTRYAESYVPIGVKSIYYAFSPIINPVQFSKVVTGFLFVVNAVLLFFIGTRFTDDFTALIMATGSFLFTSFMSKISGGMSQSFAYPLMLGYIYCLASEKLLAASLVIMVQSIFNPYIFVLCSLTHAIYLVSNYGSLFIKMVVGSKDLAAPKLWLLRLFLQNTPIIIGAIAIIVQHVFLRSSEFGDLISWVDIYGNVEYSSSGRYQLVPGPDLYWELFRPILLLLLFDDFGPVAGTLSGAVLLIVLLWALAINKWEINVSRIWVFTYLTAASLILYFVSYELIMRLFLPRRYVEFSFNLIYCMIFAVCVSSILKSLRLKPYLLVFLLVILSIVGSLRIHNLGIYNYSKDTTLYEFLSNTPKNSAIAGPPEVMDNVVTFAKRKSFITFELSHTWFTEYWKTIKKRTFEFFDAYYSRDPELVTEFVQKNGIDYLIVRERDFDPKNISKSFGGFEAFGSVDRSTASSIDREGKLFLIYFEPYQSYISKKYKDSKYFVLLDENQFKPVFKTKDYRVIKFP